MRNSLAAVLVVFSAAVPAQQLGTLFLSPAERDLLDRHRRGEAVDSTGGEAVVETREPVITGYVKRSDGKSTVFLDKRPFLVRDVRIHDRLDPRIVDRYEPLPEPPVPAAPPPEAPTPAKDSATASKGSRKE